MRKHRCGTSRREPGFDALEERSLLSGGLPAPNLNPGGFVPPPQLQMDNVSSPLEFGRAVNISFIPEWGSHLLPDLSWPSLTNDFQMPDPAGSMPGQSHGPSDVEVFANPAPPAFGPAPGGVSLVIAVSFVPGQGPSHNEPGPNEVSPQTSASSLSFPTVGTPKNQSGTIDGVRDDTEQIAVSAQSEGILANADGIAMSAGKESVQEAGGIGSGQFESAAMSLPAQLVALMDRESVRSGWLDARIRGRHRCRSVVGFRAARNGSRADRSTR